jgi:integrase
VSTSSKSRKPRRSSRGSIIKKAPGRWLVRVDYGMAPSGRRIRRGAVVHGTKDDAERRLTTMLKEQDDNPELKPSLDTVGAWVAYYFEHLTGDLAPRTVAQYHYAWGQYGARTTLAGTSLTRLSPKTCQAFVNALRKRVGPTTVHFVARMIRAMLSQAVAMGEIAKNPMAAKGGVRLPRLETTKRPRLTFEQARAFLKAAQDDRYAALWTVWLETCSRPSEIIALKWTDLQGDTLTVQRSLVRIGKTWTLDKTKTGTVRTITLSQAALAALKAHKARQAEEKLSLGPYWEEHGLIFPALGGTPLSLPNLDRRHYKPILKAANLPPMPLYSMRHTAATLLLKSGANLKDVQDRLGHARAELTLNVYLESDTKSQRDATAKLAAALAG